MRLTSRTITQAGKPVTISFKGESIAALAGESVAAALSAAGLRAFRETPSGAPRGLYCGMGACHDCVVTIDGRAGQRACMTTVADGMRIEDAAGETDLTAIAEGQAADDAPDLLVVGAGPAGLSAAAAAAEAGARVVVLDERSAAGGQYAKPLAPSHRDAAPDAQARIGDDLRARARAAGVTIHQAATVWGGFAADEIAAIVGGVAITFRPRRLVIAPGAHEAPVPIPGWTLPGVMTTGALQTLVRTQRVAPSPRVLIGGGGPLNLQLAVELLKGGVTPIAVVEAAPRPSPAAWRAAWRMARTAPDLLRDGIGMLVALKRAGVPVLWGSRVTALEGTDAVAAARIATPTGKRRIEAEVVALNQGFQPEVGLARALGAAHRFVDRGLGHLATDIDADGRTSVEGVFAVGDGASLGGSRVAMARGRLAGLAAARDLGFAAGDPAPARADLARALEFQDALRVLFPPPEARLDLITDETIVCRCEEVTAGRLRAEIAGGMTGLAALKKATRAGMGRCQGRFCSATVARLCPDPPEEPGFAAPRAPLRPVPASALMFEAPEFVSVDDPRPHNFVFRHPLPPVPVEDRRADYVVIGSGILGMSCAWQLAKEGADVLVVDRDQSAMAASTANAGSLHAQLLPYDFHEDGPEDGGPAAHSLPLAPRSIALWKQIGAEVGESLGINQNGGLMLAETPEQLAWLRRKSAMENRWGTESHVLGANELRDLAPEISERMVGADFVPAEGYGDPLRGTQALLTLCRRAGVRFLRGAEVQALERDGAAWRVTTSAGAIVAGRIVDAAGPWTGKVAAMVGLDLPVTGTVQQVIVTEPVPVPLMRHLVAMAGRHLSLKQQSANGSLLIGGGWFGRQDEDTGRTRNLRRSIEGNLYVCGQALPVLSKLSIIRAWTGINPNVDRAPLIGEAPGAPGFFTAVTACGYTLGPEVGRLAALAALGKETPDPRYSFARLG
ncbi:MAG: FAD-dependent oxidoreductase [Proteobacteria bacterium]|nr:FAD-dependent oxidoreductase [Pseudomonadota bacterium]